MRDSNKIILNANVFKYEYIGNYFSNTSHFRDILLKVKQERKLFLYISYFYNKYNIPSSDTDRAAGKLERTCGDKIRRL